MAASRKLKLCLSPFLCFLFYRICCTLDAVSAGEVEKCIELRLGQYKCDPPKINHTTQEPEDCSSVTANVPCFPAPNISCRDYKGTEINFNGSQIGFYKPIPCRNVNGYSYKVAVALSLFLGWLGADRFYLGYPALGLLKFCTVGFCGIGSLIDFMLISMQVVGPSDGSSYIVDYYGARLTRLCITNETYRKTQTYP
ncbi:TM2 domain-containing protein 1 isoform X1 [Acipenser ruthenus]|uniref:TM2 domain-containing protein 1 isoform X1 n=1 Tax=Acipenser ruthenus TaxID=7906 RepID=UPI00145A76C8|nr:TM2 domain-containing protein 1 isoform X1 [Acipenser ruthenus]